MKPDSRSEVMEFLLPDYEVRQASLLMFAEAIRYVNAFGSHKWGIYYASDRDRLRLLVGNLVVFTIHKGATWMALDSEGLSNFDDKRLVLENSIGWKWDNWSYPKYKKVPSRNGFYVPSSDHKEVWPTIKHFHFEFLAKVARKYEWLRIDSQRKHSSDWIIFLNRELKQYVPSPDYSNILQADDFQSPDEIDVQEKYFEGKAKQVLVNAYERDPKARRKSIEHHGAICAACEFNFSEFYGEVGNGYIHVHHLFPISQRDQEYEIDPLHDLKPVCPNCHAIIHKRNPPYTIEEVKEFIVRANQK